MGFEEFRLSVCHCVSDHGWNGVGKKTMRILIERLYFLKLLKDPWKVTSFIWNTTLTTLSQIENFPISVYQFEDQDWRQSTEGTQRAESKAASATKGGQGALNWREHVIIFCQIVDSEFETDESSGIDG